MNKKKNEKKTFKLNIHLLFGILFLIVLGFIVYKYFTWGKTVSRKDFFEIDNSVTSLQEPLDYFFRAPDDGEKEDDGETKILFLGNANLAAERNSDSNICNIIADKTGATVYNGGIAESYMTTVRPDYDRDIPLDAFSFYWISTLITLDNRVPTDYTKEHVDLSQDTLEALDILEKVDLNDIDVIALFYDAGDYFAFRKVYNPDNETDITCFSGALSAGLELIQSAYPHIRIIVMSPTYAFAVDENGDYQSSDIVRYDSLLSDYVNIEAQSSYYHHVSFVDTLYGGVHEDNAEKYLTDHYMLNRKGRELVADRFIEALTYYD